MKKVDFFLSNNYRIYILSSTLFFIFFEASARFFFTTGAQDFVERRIMEQELKPNKEGGVYRIFLFGESTMHGGHLYPASTIKRWLELYIDNLFGEEGAKNIEVLNLGRLGADSSFIKQSFIDTLPYEPDLAVFYTAHNDFVQVEYRHTGISIDNDASDRARECVGSGKWCRGQRTHGRRLGRRYPPDDYHALRSRRCQQRPIGRESNAFYAVRMNRQSAKLLTIHDVPKHYVLQVSIGQQLSIGREGDYR